MLIFTFVIGLFYNVTSITRSGLQDLSSDVSQVYTDANKTLQKNFERVITGSELKYALSHNPNSTFSVEDVKVDSSNYKEIYDEIHNKDTYSAEWDDGVWQMNLQKEAPRVEGLQGDIEIDVESIDVLNQPAVDEELEEGILLSYSDLELLLQEMDTDVNLLISGVFGNFSCNNKDMTSLQELLNLINFNKGLKIFKVTNSSIRDSCQVSIEIEETYLDAERVLKIYSGNLVFGNNLATLLSHKNETKCLLAESGNYSYEPLEATDVRRLSIYCAFQNEDEIVFKDSGLTIGLTLDGCYWNQWQQSCNNAWEYNCEVFDEQSYEITGYKYNVLGVITKIELKYKG